jgi:uncharacterized membrane protein HdeD (DUF308 family)
LEILVYISLLIFSLASLVGIVKGLDPKKWSSWLFGLLGFLVGFCIGFFREGANGNLIFEINIKGSLQLGAIFAFMIMFSGVVTRWQRQYYAGKAESWLLQHGQEKRFSLLACLIHRYKKTSPEDK